MSVGVYIRVSTAEQNTDGQKLAIETWLRNHGHAGAKLYVDHGASGDKLDRPAMARLQADIFAGKVRTVVVYRLDRLSRSLRDGINLLTAWLERGVRVVAVTQQLDFSGATGQLVAAVLLAVAQMEQETRRERQASGIMAAKQAGKYKGRKAGTFKVDVDRLTELAEKGLSRAEIAASMGVSVMTVGRHLKAVGAGKTC